jgi:hypothetical protein
MHESVGDTLASGGPTRIPVYKLLIWRLVEDRRGAAQKILASSALILQLFDYRDGVPTGIRTPVTAVKGRCPRPLDDGDCGSVGGGNRDRTGDLLHAMQALSQLSYTPDRGAKL